MAFDGNTLAAADLRTFTSGVISETFTLGGTDVDIMAVDLSASAGYRIDVDGGNDSYLRIFDLFGIEMRANDDNFDAGEAAGGNPFVHFVPGYSGRYYLAFSPYYLTGYDPTSTAGRTAPQPPLTSATSTLTVTLSSTLASFPGEPSIALITPRGSADLTSHVIGTDRQGRTEFRQGGFVFSAEVDLLRVDLEKGDVLVIDVNGRIQSNDFLDTVLRLFNSAGTQIVLANGTPTSQDAEAAIVAAAAGAHYIGISGEGNATYNALDGTGTMASDAGAYSVVMHINPTLLGNSDDGTINGTATDDYIVLLAGADKSDGRAGRDTIAGGDDADLLQGGAQEDQVFGEDGDDDVSGGKGSDIVDGGSGNDVVDGGAGDDYLFGAEGDDTLTGGDGGGSDTMSGGRGNDSYEGGAGNDEMFDRDNGNDTMRGDEGADSLASGLGLDLLYGGSAADTLDGGDANDVLHGDEGFDLLFGGANNDQLFGGLGEDSLSGGAGDDTLDGGAGNDTFVFESITGGLDTIVTFDTASPAEFIDLAAIFAATGAVVTASNLAQFVQVTAAGAGADSFVGVDADGMTGGQSFVTIARVNGAAPVDLFDIANFLV
jgi:Ca2+-binding RTX toxin-like protein